MVESPHSSAPKGYEPAFSQNVDAKCVPEGVKTIGDCHKRPFLSPCLSVMRLARLAFRVHSSCAPFLSIVSNLLVGIVPVRLRVYRVYDMILGLVGLSCPPTGSSNVHSLEKGSKYAKSR